MVKLFIALVRPSFFGNKLQTFIYDVQLTFLKTLRNVNEGL